MPSPAVANVSICKISREAAQIFRGVHSRYVITFHPKELFTFMSSKLVPCTGNPACSQANLHRSRLPSENQRIGHG